MRPSYGVIAGTVGHMSPEQAEGRAELDKRSDVFSFGCLLSEVLTQRGTQPPRQVAGHRGQAGTVSSIPASRFTTATAQKA